MVPGTSMFFTGMSNHYDIVCLIEYLVSINGSGQGYSSPDAFAEI